jgi:hypothetical protein
MDGRDGWRAAGVALVLAFGVALSAAHGTPSEMPGAALGWPTLLHLERAVAFIGILAVVLLVGVRALNGRFPIRFGQIEYPAEQPEYEVDLVQESHEQRLEAIEAMLGVDNDRTERI